MDGAIVDIQADPGEGRLALTTISDRPPVGLTGSGLRDLVYELHRAGIIDQSGRLRVEHRTFGRRIDPDDQGVRRFLVTTEGVDHRGFDLDEEGARVPLYLTQNDIRELQKAKGAVRAAAEKLLAKLDLRPGDLQRVILTGSFGSQLNVEAVLGLGMIPPSIGRSSRPRPTVPAWARRSSSTTQSSPAANGLPPRLNRSTSTLEPGFNTRFIESLNLTGPTSA